MKNLNTFKGFSLFNEVIDVNLRARNRAIIMANITEDNLTDNKRLTPRGAVLVMGYFEAVPEQERDVTYKAYEQSLKERGFKV